MVIQSAQKGKHIMQRHRHPLLELN